MKSSVTPRKESSTISSAWKVLKTVVLVVVMVWYCGLIIFEKLNKKMIFLKNFLDIFDILRGGGGRQQQRGA